MITLQNYELFVDKCLSKKEKNYYGVFIKIGDKKILLSFITESTYNYISDLSK